MGEVAIFWDYENARVVARGINVPLAESILECTAQYGNVRVKKVNSNWRAVSNAIVQTLYSLGFEPIQVPMGKTNSVDVKIAVDCLDVTLTLPSITHVIIVTGDKDFILVVGWLRSHKKTVVVIGMADMVSDHLALSASEFVSLEEISKEHQQQAETAPSSDNPPMLAFDDAVECLIQAINVARDNDKSTRFAMIDNLMRGIPAFAYTGVKCIQKPDNTGHFTQFTAFVNAAEEAGRVKTGTIEGFTELFLNEENPAAESEFSPVSFENVSPEHWTAIFDGLEAVFAEVNPGYPGHRLTFISNRLLNLKKEGEFPFSNRTLRAAVVKLIEIGAMIQRPDEFYTLAENYSTNRDEFFAKVTEKKVPISQTGLDRPNEK